jgi:hypothetical protein
MAHVGIERLGAGDREHDAGQGEERDTEVAEQEVERVGRRERLEDVRVVRDACHPARGDGKKPDDHHRAEDPADRSGSSALHREEQHNDDRRDRDDQYFERRVEDLEPFHRGQHRDRRGDHAVAEEQRGAEDADCREPGGPSTASAVPPQQRDQRHDAALAIVVDAHGQEHVGDGHDDHHRPEHQRHDTKHVGSTNRDWVRVRGVEHRLDRVDRTGADIAEHHAQCAHDNCEPHHVTCA